MAESKLATRASRGHRTLCLPFEEASYRRVVGDPAEFRRAVDACFRDAPELFPAGFDRGYELKDDRTSAKLRPADPTHPAAGRRRLQRAAVIPRPLHGGPRRRTSRPRCSCGPSACPLWALAHVFGRDPMYRYRLEVGLGRNSVVGTTARRAELPEHLLADEHHQTINGEKVYLATTVGDGCVLGAEPAASAGAAELTTAYGVFKAEAHDVEPEYAPRTVSVDGWASTHQAWLALFPLVALLRCSCTAG